jgi:starvation-inducible outer membrane lipoprotein
MNKLLVLVSLLLLGGCISSPESLSEDNDSNDVSDSSETNDSIIDFNSTVKGVDICGNSYTYNTIVFNEKSYIIKLPIPCSQEPYIEKGTPSDLNDKFDQHSVSSKTISY